MLKSPVPDFYALFDSVFNDSFFEPSNTVKASICSSNFPPSNISFDEETENYIIDIALAGYTKDAIKIEYDNGFIRVKGDKSSIKSDKRKYAKTGIKTVDSFETSFGIDIAKYDISKLKAGMENGILTIEVPVKQDFIKNQTFAIS